MITFEELLIEEAQRDGYVKGKKEAKENEIFRLITRLSFSNTQIVEYAEVPLKYVKKIRAGIKTKKITH